MNSLLYCSGLNPVEVKPRFTHMEEVVEEEEVEEVRSTCSPPGSHDQIDDWHRPGYRCRGSRAEETRHLCGGGGGGVGVLIRLRHFHFKFKEGGKAAEGNLRANVTTKDHQWSSCGGSGLVWCFPFVTLMFC